MLARSWLESEEKASWLGHFSFEVARMAITMRQLRHLHSSCHFYCHWRSSAGFCCNQSAAIWMIIFWFFCSVRGCSLHKDRYKDTLTDMDTHMHICGHQSVLSWRLDQLLEAVELLFWYQVSQGAVTNHLPPIPVCAFCLCRRQKKCWSSTGSIHNPLSHTHAHTFICQRATRGAKPVSLMRFQRAWTHAARHRRSSAVQERLKLAARENKSATNYDGDPCGGWSVEGRRPRTDFYGQSDEEEEFIQTPGNPRLTRLLLWTARCEKVVNSNRKCEFQTLLSSRHVFGWQSAMIWASVLDCTWDDKVFSNQVWKINLQWLSNFVRLHTNICH